VGFCGGRFAFGQGTLSDGFPRNDVELTSMIRLRQFATELMAHPVKKQCGFADRKEVLHFSGIPSEADLATASSAVNGF
jgi:hypothetical protein